MKQYILIILLGVSLILNGLSDLSAHSRVRQHDTSLVDIDTRLCSLEQQCDSLRRENLQLQNELHFIAVHGYAPSSFPSK